MQAPRRLTVLPLMIFVAMLAFSVRLADIYTAISSSSGSAHAEMQPSQDTLSDMIRDPHAKMDEAQGDAHADGPVKISEGDQESHEEGHEDGHEEDPDAVKNVFDDMPSEQWRDANDEDLGFTSAKMEVMEDIVERRKELDQREKELKTKEALLKAAELELDRKVQELNGLRKKIEALLDKQSEEELARIQSLVKIYEGMKAKEAAAIFDTLDLDILVTVMSNMSERRLAPILAKMNPERARTVTIMLAEQKQLPSLPQR